MGDWRVSLMRVAVIVAATLFVSLVIGALGLLSFLAAVAVIQEGDVVKGFLYLGAMFLIALESMDLLNEFRDENIV